MISVELERHRFRAGDAVNGRVHVHYAGKARSLEVFVTYTERSASFSHDHVWLRSGPLVQGDLQAGWVFPFSIVLPPYVYPGVMTPYGSLAWELDAKVDIPNATDVHVRQQLDVVYSVVNGQVATQMGLRDVPIASQIPA